MTDKLNQTQGTLLITLLSGLLVGLMALLGWIGYEVTQFPKEYVSIQQHQCDIDALKKDTQEDLRDIKNRQEKVIANTECIKTSLQTLSERLVKIETKESK